MKYFDSYNLVNSKPNEENAENALLWTAELLYLSETEKLKNDMIVAVDCCRISPGIFSQHPSKSHTGNEAYMSHDQLTAIFSTSTYYGTSVAAEIWAEIERQWYRYNTVEIPQTLKEKLMNRRFLHPRDVIYYGLCVGKWWAKLLFPLFVLILWIGTLSNVKKIGDSTVIKTDDELLNFVRLYPLRNKNLAWSLLWKWYYRRVVKDFGSYNAVFRIYFPFDDHPNVVASKDI